MRYNDYTRLVEDDYFGNVTAANMNAILACFAPDAEITIRHGDHPPRRLKGQPAAGEEHLCEFWRHLNGNYQAAFSDFEHVVDTVAGRCAATFTVTLTPKATSPYAAAGVQTLRNCNFFWITAGKISRMIVYYSNAAADGIARPTGYPPEKK
jgi:hypothetical protein